MSNNSQQINISYLPKEDRLLLKVKTAENTEYRVWLTRRFVKILLKALNDKMNNFGGADAIAVSQETQKTLKQGALEKKYEVLKEPKLPFGEEGILATQIKMSSNKSNNLFIQILPDKGQGININLDKKMLYMMHNIINQGISNANWDLISETIPSSEIH